MGLAPCPQEKQSVEDSVLFMIKAITLGRHVSKLVSLCGVALGVSWRPCPETDAATVNTKHHEYFDTAWTHWGLNPRLPAC